MIRLLMLNWRDWKHPQAGGAEVVTHEVLKRLVADYGYEATLFTAIYPGAPETETIDGVRIVRAGSQRTVHWQAYQFYKAHPNEFDVVVDQTNTIPFFTPLYVREPHTLFIHQLAREVWWHEAPVLAPVGYPLESAYLRLYNRTPVVTVSQSTKDDLVALGHPANSIAVVPQGISVEPLSALPTKSIENPKIIFLGRLVSSKRPDHAIRAFARIHEAIPNATLTIMGSTKSTAYDRSLRLLATKLGVENAITFAGFVDEVTKRRTLQEATLILVTSVREGWGLIVTEAAAYGTPAAVYDIPGLRDAVGRGTLGVMSDPTPRALGDAALGLLKDQARYDQLRQAAWADAKTRNWDRTTKAFHDHLESVMENPKS